MKPAGAPGAITYAAVGVVSATGLAYEILLIRVFSFSQWHHFASLAVALALLGFGAAGTVLTLIGKRAIRWGDRLFLGGLLLGAFGMALAFQTSQWVSVRPLFAPWDLGELGKLLLVDFVSFVPFFGFALAIGQVFVRWPESTSRLYAANLLGSGVGCLAATLLLSALFLESALVILPLILLVMGAAFSWARRASSLYTFGFLGGAVLCGIWMFQGVPPLPLSDFKRLAYLLDLPDTKVLDRLPGLRSEVRVVESGHARFAPGLSIHWMEAIPSQDVIAIGADQTFPLPNRDDDLEAHKATLGYLPYLLRPKGLVAWLGTSEWQSREKGRPILWVIENPQVSSIMMESDIPRELKFLNHDTRLFLDTDSDRYSIIVFSRAAHESDAASEDYLLTVEGLTAGLSRVENGGVLAIPFPLSNPPRFAPKLLATAVQALREISNAEPWEQTVMLRSLHAGLLLISNQPFGLEDITTIRGFSERWGFDLVALPGLEESEANRFHRWKEPILYRSARAILNGDGSLPLEASWFSMRAPRDRSPYFWRTIEWRRLPELWETLGRSGMVWLDWTLLLTAVKLLVAGVLATFLILLPLGRLSASHGPRSRLEVLLYFAALGLGYMLVEMAVLQRCIRYLAHPVITASFVFTVFLLGSGLGSLRSPTGFGRSSSVRVFGPIIVWGAVAFIILGPGEGVLLALPNRWRIAGIGMAVLPLAWSMGRAFPWGLRQLDCERPLIPWAWGINGFASVLGAPLAVLLSVHWSQVATFSAGQLCYLVAGGVAFAWGRIRGDART